MNQTSLSPAAEDCLLLLYRMQERQEQATTSGVARALGVADSTITVMVQKLSRRKLVHHRARQEITLTATGLQHAQRMIRRHRLIETYLWTELGYSWEEVHAEAEHLEHAVSDRFVDAIADRLHHPTVDPHGDPIPDARGEEIQRDLHRLTALKEGERAKVARILGGKTDVLSYLTSLGIELGAELEVMALPGLDTVVRVRVGGREAAIGAGIAADILVER